MTRAKHATRPYGARTGAAGKLAFCARVLCLALALLVLPGLIGVPVTSQKTAPRTDSLAPLVLEAHARDRAGSDAGSTPKSAPEAVEKRVLGLLVPVFGEGRVVARASLAPTSGGESVSHADSASLGARDEAGTRALRPPVRVAVIIDAGSLAGLPTSPESLRAEQDRLSTLLVHAAGLDFAHGDSLAVSFLPFAREAIPVWAVAGLALLALALVGGLVSYGLARRRENDGRKGKGVNNLTRELLEPEREPEPQCVSTHPGTPAVAEQGPSERTPSREALARLADRLRTERPQARAVALSLLKPRDAAHALVLLPRDLQAGTLACMVLQEKVQDEVLELVERTFLDGLERARDRECDPVARTLKVLDALASSSLLDASDASDASAGPDTLGQPEKRDQAASPGSFAPALEELLAEVASISPEAGQALAAARA